MFSSPVCVMNRKRTKARGGFDRDEYKKSLRKQCAARLRQRRRSVLKQLRSSQLERKNLSSSEKVKSMLCGIIQESREESARMTDDQVPATPEDNLGPAVDSDDDGLTDFLMEYLETSWDSWVEEYERMEAESRRVEDLLVEEFGNFYIQQDSIVVCPVCCKHNLQLRESKPEKKTASLQCACGVVLRPSLSSLGLNTDASKEDVLKAAKQLFTSTVAAHGRQCKGAGSFAVQRSALVFVCGACGACQSLLDVA